VRTGTVIDLFGGVRGTAFAALSAVLLAVLIVVLVLHRITKAELAGCKAMSATYQSTQQANGRTIDDLRGRLANIVQDHEADRRRSADAAKELVAEKEQIERNLAAKQAELEELYARSPSARTWSVTGVDRDVLDRLPRPR
jgi:Skp family chaperone for outer membrane proteins